MPQAILPAALALPYTHSATLASLQAPVLRRWSPHPRLHLACTSLHPLHKHHAWRVRYTSARLPPTTSVKQFGVAALVQVGQCWLYLRHRGSSRPAFSRHQTSPRRPTSARARHRLGCSSLRTCVKRLDRSGVLPSISTLPPPPSHVGCHQSQSKRHSPFV